MLRATSSRSSVFGADVMSPSPSASCQPSSTASGVVTAKRPGRYRVEPRPFTLGGGVVMRTVCTVIVAGCATPNRIAG